MHTSFVHLWFTEVSKHKGYWRVKRVTGWKKTSQTKNDWWNDEDGQLGLVGGRYPDIILSRSVQYSRLVCVPSAPHSLAPSPFFRPSFLPFFSLLVTLVVVPVPCLAFPPFALRLAMCSCATAYTSLPALTTPNNNQRERKEMNCERRSLHTHNSDAKWWRLPPDIQQTMSVTDDLNLSGGKFEYELWKIITSSKPRNCNVMTFWHGRIYREKNRWWHFNILAYSFHILQL